MYYIEWILRLSATEYNIDLILSPSSAANSEIVDIDLCFFEYQIRFFSVIFDVREKNCLYL